MPLEERVQRLEERIRVSEPTMRTAADYETHIRPYIAELEERVRQLEQERDVFIRRENEAWRTSENWKNRAVEAEARVASLTEALESLLDVQNDYPTTVDPGQPVWREAFREARRVLSSLQEGDAGVR